MAALPVQRWYFYGRRYALARNRHPAGQTRQSPVSKTWPTWAH